ncbi:hypothetical protein L7F22_063355 [Adiantum nelumboides]|nr:hypothetical protein [Adiantum nelumboides]
MLVYQDLISRDELLSCSFPYKEILNGILWEMEGNWVVKGVVDVDIGANPCAEGGEDKEGVNDESIKATHIFPEHYIKVVDIVDTFRLQEQPSFFDKKTFLAFMKKYIKTLSEALVKTVEIRRVIFQENGHVYRSASQNGDHVQRGVIPNGEQIQPQQGGGGGDAGNDEPVNPRSYIEAMKRDDHVKWEKAMNFEMDSLHKNGN